MNGRGVSFSAIGILLSLSLSLSLRDRDKESTQFLRRRPQFGVTHILDLAEKGATNVNDIAA